MEYMLIHVHWEIGWESETQDSQHLKTGKSLDKKLDGSFLYPCYGKAQEYKSCMVGDISCLHSFFPCFQVLLILSLLFLLILWYQIVKTLQKGINVMFVEQSWEEISPPGMELTPTSGSSKEQSLSWAKWSWRTGYFGCACP